MQQLYRVLVVAYAAEDANSDEYDAGSIDSEADCVRAAVARVPSP